MCVVDKCTFRYVTYQTTAPGGYVSRVSIFVGYRGPNLSSFLFIFFVLQGHPCNADLLDVVELIESFEFVRGGSAPPKIGVVRVNASEAVRHFQFDDDVGAH